MEIELDHVSVLVQPDTDAIAKLAEAGYAEERFTIEQRQGVE